MNLFLIFVVTRRQITRYAVAVEGKEQLVSLRKTKKRINEK